MRYQGGKHRLAKYIAGNIHKLRTEKHNVYLEPFVGSGAVLERVDMPVKIASDIDGDLIAFWNAIQNGWKPPDTLTRDQYNHYKDNPDDMPPELRCFVSVFCSFSGKRWGGFASGENRDHANEAYRGAIKRAEKIADVWFIHSDYRKLNPNNAIIYCDPPYKGTTPYKGIDFDSNEFWNIALNWSMNGNRVLVSEVSAPDELIESEQVRVIWSKEYLSSTPRDSSKYKPRTEKLFLLDANKVNRERQPERASA